MKKTVFTVALFLCFAVSTALACSDARNYHNFTCNLNSGANPPVHSADCPEGGRVGRLCQPRYLSGETRPNRGWLQVGPDHSEPWLDPLLMRHSFYSEFGMNSLSEATMHFPTGGFTGTADGFGWGTYIISGIPDACGNVGESFIQSMRAGGEVRVVSGGKLTAGDNVPVSGPVTRVPVVYPVRPRFPDLREGFGFVFPERTNSIEISGTTQTLSPDGRTRDATILEGGTLNLTPGVHYFNTLLIRNGTLNVMVEDGKDSRTIIYLSGELTHGSGGTVSINTVDKNGNPVPFSCYGDKGTVLFIVRGCVMFPSGAHRINITASLIVLGQFSINPATTIAGQVLFDRGSAFAGVNFAERVTFLPTKTFAVNVPPITFGEDKHWAWRNSGCDHDNEPKYYNQISHGVGIGNPISKSVNQRAYYDTTIAVSLSEPIENGYIDLKWKIKHLPGVVEPIGNRTIDAEIQRGVSVLVGGKLEGGYITGTFRFTQNTTAHDIILYIIDRDGYNPDLIFDLGFEVADISEDNKLVPYPTTITIKSDNDCTPEEEKCPPHEWGDWVITPATCFANGSEIRECSLCRVKETKIIQQLPEDDPMCLCDHDFGDWKITKPAECDEEGSERQVCKLCGHTETRPIPKIDCPPVIDLFTPNSIIEFNNCNESAGQVVGTLSSSNQTESKFVLTDDLGGWFEVDENTGVITTTDTYRGLSTQSPVIIKAKAVLTTILGELESEEITISIEITPWAQTFSFEQTGRIIEYFDGGQNSGQVAGTLLRARSVITNQQFPGWFAIDGNNRIVTTDAYRADYELGQNKINISVKNDCIDKDTTITIAISPWNDNPFDPQEDFAVVDIDRGNVIMIDVLANDNHDKDLPQSANRQKIIGLTLGEEISPARRIPVGEPRPVHSRSIITSLNAVVTIRNDSIMYDISGNGNINGGERDVFYYTALDTAIYTDHLGNSYQTDVWVKSVRVTVDIRRKKFDFYVFPQPLNLSNNNLNRFDGFVDCYNTNDVRNKNGVTIIFEAKGSPITNLSEQKGGVMIFDQLGNLVRERIEMEFINIICGDEKDGVVGVAVWDAKNRNKRTVAPGAYMALVEVDVTFDDGHREVRPYRSPIMIITAPERK